MVATENVDGLFCCQFLDFQGIVDFFSSYDNSTNFSAFAVTKRVYFSILGEDKSMMSSAGYLFDSALSFIIK